MGLSANRRLAHERQTGRLNFAFSSSTLVMSTDARHVVMSLPIPTANAEQPTIHNPGVLCNRALTVLYGCSEMPRLSHYSCHDYSSPESRFFTWTAQTRSARYS